MKISPYNLEIHKQKEKKMDLLNSKISVVLPELMSRNLKLGERLKNKLKVSTLFNNIEHRNKKYLKSFIFSSNKRAKDLKSGLEMSKALKQGSKKLSLLRNQMKEDLILKNSDILLKEKKLLSENTEQETHSKINDFIHSIKNAIKPPTSIRLTSSKKLMKSMSDDEIMKAKNIIGYKIKKEESDIQDKINKYLDKMRSSFDNKNFELNKIKIRKDFNKYTENMYLENDFKLINYSKVKPQPIKDKESANLVRIKKFLYPSNFDENTQKESKESKDSKEKENKTTKSNNKIIILKRNSSMNDIYINKNIKQTTSTEDKLNYIDVNGKDTMEVLNNLVDQGEFLSERLEKKLKKVNSLIEINLPYPSNYELILKYFKKHPDLKNNNGHYYKKKELLTPQSEDRKKIEITPYMRSKLLSIKEDIEEKKEEFIEKNIEGINSLPYISNKNIINLSKNNNNDKSFINKSSETKGSSISSDIKNDKVFITSNKK